MHFRSTSGLRSHSPQVIAGGGGAAEGGIRAAVLGLLHAPAFAGYLVIAAAEGGVARADLEGDVGGGCAFGPLAGDVVFEFGRGPFAGGVVEHFSVFDSGERDHGIDGERLPDGEAKAAFGDGLELLGEDGGVGCGFENLLRDFAGDLVVAVAVCDAADEGGDYDLRAFAADGEDGVVEDAVVAPSGEGFLLRFRKAEVDFCAPELLGAVVLAGLEELAGADEAEGVVGIGGHGVLAAFAAGEGEEGAADAEAAREIGEQGAVFVVRMGDDHHEAGGGGEAPEGLLEGCCATVFGEGLGYAGRLGELVRDIDARRDRRCGGLLSWSSSEEQGCEGSGDGGA